MKINVSCDLFDLKEYSLDKMNIVYENLLNTDYKKIRQLCQIEPDVFKICQTDLFWRDKYLKDYGSNTYEYHEPTIWKDEYQYRYTLENPKKIYYLMSSNEEESEPIVTLKAKNRNDAYKFIAYLCNHHLIPNHYIRTLINQYNDPIKESEELNTLYQEYCEKDKLPIYLGKEVMIHCVQHYYLKPNYLYYIYDKDDNVYILDLFKYLYLKRYCSNQIKEPLPDKITKPVLTETEIASMLNIESNSSKHWIELVEEEYYQII